MILDLLEKEYYFQRELINLLPNGFIKMKAIGLLVHDIGGKNLNTVAKFLGVSWRYTKHCYKIFLGKILPNNVENRGRKSIEETFPTIKEDIDNIVKDDCSCDPDFKHECLYVRLTANEIKNRLIESSKYSENNCPSITSIKKILKLLKIKLIKVKKVKPVKKIKETDTIFENVKNRKKECLKDDSCVLISIDTKDRVAIGNFSRYGYNYNEIKAADHDFKNEYITPFGIFDIKTGIPHFISVENKVTAECMVNNIEIFLVENYLNQNKKIKKLAILSDNGPENKSNRTYFMYKLILLAIKLNIEIELIYYPPYHSKYNPIERIWARLEKVWNGSLILTKSIAINFMENLTWIGNKSTVKDDSNKYELGLKTEKEELDKLKDKYVSFTKNIEKWSFIIRP